MSLADIKNALRKALCASNNSLDYEDLLPALRELRKSAALEGRDFQLSVISNEELVVNLVEFIDKMYKNSSPDADSTLAFGIGVQCVVNLMNDNDDARRFFADKYLPLLVSWFKCDHPKYQNYVAAALLSIEKVGGLNLNDKEFVSLLIESAESGVEFSLHLLQNLVKSHHYCELSLAASNEGKLFLLQILESAISGCDDFSQEVQFTCNLYKKSCDNLMSKISSVDPFIAQELALMLEFLASLSHKQTYMELMQKDASLIISSAYLLRGIHECVSQKKTWKESLDEAVLTIKNKEVNLTNQPFFGVKGNLIRLLGNLAYKNFRNQTEIRDAGCIPIILDSCKLDGENPFIKEWSILAIRNLCEGNLENQKFIKDMKYQGYEIVQQLSLTLDGGSGTSVNIAPLKREPPS